MDNAPNQDEDSPLRLQAYNELQDKLQKAAEDYAEVLEGDGEDPIKVALTMAAGMVLYASSVARMIGTPKSKFEDIIKSAVDEAYEQEQLPLMTQVGGAA